MNATPLLEGQVALVTGASSGLGHRFARTLASAGATVAVTARRESRLRDLVAEIDGAGGRAVPFVLDVSEPTSIADVVGAVCEKFGTPAILVNNAGMPDAQRAHKLPLDVVDQVLATNLRGPWLLACEVARRLIAEERPGRIVNISSMTAYQYAGEGAALYSVTKAALGRMTEVLAVEWARHHINVNAIAPGAFESEMMDGMLARVGDISTGFPRRRIGAAAQLDSTLLYLVTPASDAVTGTVIKVDDGQMPR